MDYEGFSPEDLKNEKTGFVKFDRPLEVTFWAGGVISHVFRSGSVSSEKGYQHTTPAPSPAEVKFEPLTRLYEWTGGPIKTPGPFPTHQEILEWNILNLPWRWSYKKMITPAMISRKKRFDRLRKVKVKNDAKIR